VKDKGWIASAEYRHPVGRAPVPGLSEGDQAGQVWLAFFVDAGRAWDHFGTSDRRFIWSVGPGARWDIAEGVSAQLYWGLRQKNVVLPNASPQDKGLHFRFAAARSF
jgi:hemolysin activation/secretion protein